MIFKWKKKEKKNETHVLGTCYFCYLLIGENVRNCLNIYFNLSGNALWCPYFYLIVLGIFSHWLPVDGLIDVDVYFH